MVDNKVNIANKEKFIGPKPFLRWAGGKQKLVHSLLKYTPNKNSFNCYFEPFFGGGSLFFSIEPSNAVISDINSDLMNCYKQISRHTKKIFDIVSKHIRNDSEKYYYSLREINISDLSKIEQAARFIYLNKASFNGIYRVNKNGKFNVPYGPSPSGLTIPSFDNLKKVSKLLSNSTILDLDFEIALSNAKKNDFVYLDPPYPPLSKTAYFNHYTKNRFNWDEQLRVLKIFDLLSKRGCKVMLSNSYNKEIIKLYSEYKINTLDTIRWLGANGDRFSVREIVVTNYS